MATDLNPVERPKVGAELVRPILPVLIMLAVMWVEEIVDTPLDGHLDRFGIRPRRLDGLDGILFAPFLHSGFGHLISNTLPFLILGAAIAFSSTRHFLQATAIIMAIGGFGTWLTGSANTLVIGASGLVFGYLTFLVSRGVFARKASYIVGGLVVLLVYGGILWGLLPRPGSGISWQGHLFGAIGGVVAAWVVYGRNREAAKAPVKPSGTTSSFDLS